MLASITVRICRNFRKGCVKFKIQAGFSRVHMSQMCQCLKLNSLPWFYESDFIQDVNLQIHQALENYCEFEKSEFNWNTTSERSWSYCAPATQYKLQ